jgi:hypothetical protein
MAFSMSPSVEVKEYDNSQYINNLPSSKTGMVLRADYGPCNRITPITNEAELLKWFGKPTAANYQDWFQAWNFLQYAASLYVIRPIETSVKNAGAALTGETFSTGVDQDNLYNTEVAELTLQNDSLFTSDRLYFFNRFITSEQKLGIAVCSSPEYWKSSIANEFSGLVTTDATTKDTMNKIGGLISDVSASTIVNLSNNTLKAGSKFISNDNKIYTVKTSATSSITLNAGILPRQISKYTAKIKTAGLTIDVATTGVVFDTTETFKLSKFAIVELGTGKFFYVTDLGTDVNGERTVKFEFVPGAGATTNTATFSDGYVYSNTEYFVASLSNDYYVGVSPTGSYEVPVGTTVIKVKSGFNYPAGSKILFQHDGENYVQVASDQFPEESDLPGDQIDSYEIISSNSGDNTITLDVALSKKIVFSDASGGLFDDIDIQQPTITGINLFSTVYDDSLIRKVKTTLVDAETGKATPIIIEYLAAFNNLFDYEPEWIQDQFVVIVLQKNSSSKFEIVEKKLASYNPAGRDSQGRNIFANEIFFYGSSYVFCKVNEDETLNKANTATGALVKFQTNTITLLTETPSANLVLGTDCEYGTVYPVATTIDDNDVETITYDLIKQVATYDPNNYNKADIQFAADQFSDAESFDINILIAHQLDLNGMSEIAESRKDCFAIVPYYDYVKLVGKTATEASQTLLNEFGTQTVSDAKIFTTNGTYSALYGNMKYQYDKFNDVNRWIAVGGDVAGLYAQTDTNRDPWWAPAGLERGKVKNVIKLAFNPNKQNRDELYINAINPIMSIAGEGAGIVFGQKTATAKPSALDRVNVRRLLITIEKALASACKYSLFEFNDAFTRNRLKGIIDPFLRTVKARRGLYSYGVVCDSSNNPPEIIDQNGLVIDVFVSPTKAAEFIVLNVNIQKTGDVSFSESAS